jgi:class 3 adenylate cyclase
LYGIKVSEELSGFVQFKKYNLQISMINKKEIVYHGDVVNTTARIQDECNKYGQKFLLSEYMLQNVELPEYLRSEFVGELQLKGKEKKVKIFGLKSIAES